MTSAQELANWFTLSQLEAALKLKQGFHKSKQIEEVKDGRTN